MSTRRRWAALVGALPMLLGTWAPAAPAPSAPSLGIAPFLNSRDPPFYRRLDAATQARAQLGHAVFNTQFVPAGTAGGGRIDGLGPLFNAASCDECHNEGADARGPRADGPAPPNLVVQLQRPAPPGAAAPGDPRYGQVLNTASLPGLQPEGSVTIHYRPLPGHYPDGQAWTLREPQYRLSGLRYGPLGPDTIVKPRLAPALFGDGLLDAVPVAAIVNPSDAANGGVPAWQGVGAQRQLGRLGWQGSSLSIRDQTGKALAREMGLTNPAYPQDDCTAVEVDCRAAANGGAPEVSAQLFDAVVEFERWLAVPAAPAAAVTQAARGRGAELFAQVGCAACHRAQLPVLLPAAPGASARAWIDPYTDLLLHDLGPALADRDASGRPVRSLWRTAPLWGLGYRIGREQQLTLLHDGRARSVEEAILWHDGQAQAARLAFEQLPAAQRQVLLQWVGAR